MLVNGPDFTINKNDVIESELEYLKKRRKANKLNPPERNRQISDTEGLWGICFSGGGIRSATFCLGLMQRLIKHGIFKRFDYLSTVSGGGYIGSCLSSLLSDPKKSESRSGNIGVDPENSPFVALHGMDDYQKKAESRLSVRHQMHHLRTHGEYLIPRKGFFSRDMQRAIGSIFAGILHHSILFLFVLLTASAVLHGVLHVVSGGGFSGRENMPFLHELNYFETGYYTISDHSIVCLQRTLPPENIEALAHLKGKVFYSGKGDFIATVQNTLPVQMSARQLDSILVYSDGSGDSGPTYLSNITLTWLVTRLLQPLQNLFVTSLPTFLPFHLVMAILGILWYLVFFLRGRAIRDSLSVDSSAAGVQQLSGYNLEDQIVTRFVERYNRLSLVFICVIVLASAACNIILHFAGQYTLSVFVLPVGFALGAAVASVTLTNFSKSKTSERDRVFRSLVNALQGGTFYHLLFALVIPFLVIILFSMSFFDFKFWWSLGAFSLSFLLFRKGPGSGKLGKRLARYSDQLASLFIIIFVFLSFDVLSEFLIHHVYPMTIWSFGVPMAAVCTALIATGVLYALGMIVDANRISPHYFYRDRLTEAYLQTDARVEREDRYSEQGKPLAMVRNDEDLRLTELAENNNRGPYHIIVGALNLQASNELNRKEMLSDHFIFSRNYVGSQTTGYVQTDLYRAGRTKLARAMTISAAAAGSGMGFHSFKAQAFLATLFNVRLGYWMANPWFYCKLKFDFHSGVFKALALEGMTPELVQKLRDQFAGAQYVSKNSLIEALAKSGITDRETVRLIIRHAVVHPERRVNLWLGWLWRELNNKFHARDRLVNLSDGGHTGDNLGLLPLLQRRLAVIVVCDGEADGTYSFNSFNNAVRMAFVEENIAIDIDLGEITPGSDNKNQTRLSGKSVAIGKIIYPPRTERERETYGTLIYLKSSLSEPEIGPYDQKLSLPVHVKNYHASHASFPHQSTSDQFFDDAQFEAYRALGEHVAEQAVSEFDILRVRDY